MPFSSFFCAFFRGWGGVCSIRRSTSISSGWLSPFWGFFSGIIHKIGLSKEKDKPKVSADDPASNPPWKISDKEYLIEWVAQFLNYWEDTDMLYGPAAEIIVDQILSYLNQKQQSESEQLIPLREPQIFFCTG